MSDTTVMDPAIFGVGAGASKSRGAAAAATLLKVITPDLRQDPRMALRDMRIKDPLRKALEDRVDAGGLSLKDGAADDPYADAEGNILKRHFTLLASESDEAVLLQIPDWIANDGGNIGAMDELRDAFANRKVRIVAENVLTPSRSLDKTMPRIWRERAKIDLEFISWRYVEDVVERRLPPGEVFGLAGGAAPGTPAPAPAPTSDKNKIKRVFISSTGLDLKDYREAARDICLGLQLYPDMMEYFEAMGLGATAGSKKKLEQADLYVGIFAHRYGYIEQGYDRSVTEIEFDYAEERNIERLCFVIDPAHPWPPNAWDAEHNEQMKAFKKRVETLIRGQFTTKDSLKALLTQALTSRRP
jgi:hypothetical protein